MGQGLSARCEVIRSNAGHPESQARVPGRVRHWGNSERLGAAAAIPTTAARPPARPTVRSSRLRSYASQGARCRSGAAGAKFDSRVAGGMQQQMAHQGAIEG